MNKKSNKGFTLIELLAVVVVLGVVVTIAVLAVKPRTRSAKKNLFIADAKSYMKAAKEAYTLDEAEGEVVCHNISDLNSYVQKHDNNYTGTIISEFTNGTSKQTISITDGRYYIFGSNNITSSNLSEEMPAGFISTCINVGEYIPQDIGTNTLAYKLLMAEGKSTLAENIAAIEQRSASVDFNNTEASSTRSGLYVAEDDDGMSYYYRGIINNNWIEFGGFYWRIVRINGDGSIRLIYSGLASSTHTGEDAAIRNSAGSVTTNFADVTSYNISLDDISSLTSTQVQVSYANGRYSSSHVGYMYNPATIIMSYPAYHPSNQKRLNGFPQFNDVNNTKTYYFFKNFDINTNCIAGSDTDETGTCYLTCRSIGDDCIESNWNTLATTTGSYSTTADGVYPATNATNFIYTSPYKYTCWANGTVVKKNNSDGTTSAYIACPMVVEIVGTIKNQATQARVIYHGFFSESKETAYANVKDNNIKKELELWYSSKILNKKDSSNQYDLENYLTDKIFCNDRTSITTSFPLNYSGSYIYGPYTRNNTKKEPSFKCPDKSRDGFTLSSSSDSTVMASGAGNMLLKYPVGILTVDEATYAGGKQSTNNNAYYLCTGKNYWTMSPYVFHNNYINSYVYYLESAGALKGTRSSTKIGVRPVINLKSDVVYKSGSGTEADPYIITL